MREVRDRPALVTGDDIEQIRDARREALDAQRGVEEHGADVGGADQVLQIVVGARNHVELEFQLAVHGLQLLVDRLQLLLAGLEFLRRRAILLID